MNLATQWVLHLPAQLQYSRSNLVKQRDTGQGGAYLLMHGVYELIMCAVNYPLFTGELLQSAGAELAGARRNQHASELSKMVIDAQELQSEMNGRCFIRSRELAYTAAPMLGYSIFVGSLIHIETIFSAALEQQVIARRYLIANLKAMSNLQKHSTLIDRLCGTLLEVYLKKSVGSDQNHNGYMEKKALFTYCFNDRRIEGATLEADEAQSAPATAPPGGEEQPPQPMLWNSDEGLQASTEDSLLFPPYSLAEWAAQGLSLDQALFLPTGPGFLMQG